MGLRRADGSFFSFLCDGDDSFYVEFVVFIESVSFEEFSGVGSVVVEIAGGALTSRLDIAREVVVFG